MESKSSVSDLGRVSRMPGVIPGQAGIDSTSLCFQIPSILVLPVEASFLSFINIMMNFLTIMKTNGKIGDDMRNLNIHWYEMVEKNLLFILLGMIIVCKKISLNFRMHTETFRG